MRMESLISVGLLKSDLKRFWPLWVVYLVALFMVLLAPTYSAVLGVTSFADGAEDVSDALQGVWAIMEASTLVCTFFAGIIVAVSLNEHLFDSKAATFVGALPLRRRTVFATNYVAGFVAQAAVLLIAFLALAGMHAVLPALQMLLAAQWFGMACALNFVFYSLAHLLCQLTGSRPVAVVLYLVANLLSVCIEAAIRLAIAAFQYGMGDWTFVADWLSPAVGIAHYGLYINGIAFHVEWTVLAGYCAAGVAFVVLAGSLFSRRSLEMAGEAVAWPKLRPVLKYLAGVSGALLFAAVAVLLYWSDSVDGLAIGAARAVQLVVCMIVGGVLGLLFAEMAMSRTTRVLRKCVRGGFVLACVTVAFAAIVCTDAFGVASYVPETSQVESVMIRVDGQNAGTYASQEGIAEACQLHRDILAYGGGDVSRHDYEWDVVLTYSLDNGTTLQRRYPVLYGDDVYEKGLSADDEGGALLVRVCALASSEEGRTSRYAQYFGDDGSKYAVAIEYNQYDADPSQIKLSSKDSRDFIENALKPDVMEHLAGEFRVGMTASDEADDPYDAAVLLTDADGGDFEEIWLGKNSTPNCVKWIQDNKPEIKLTPDSEMPGEESSGSAQG